ncbi:hypothetical protein [uncultured Aquimarina sp.]|uniref:hypothetical protein n=1 Tax=uncultured Aquimarina sp. TaxID=575652 RepID=UPI002603042E|nr:hypothetical protein [uncultured Aquimarina sp.]
MLKIKSLVEDSSISDVDALDSLNEVIENYSKIQQHIAKEDKELYVYSKEIKKLIEINKKARLVEESLNNLKFENQKIYNELMIYYEKK